jgi:hypothetical protein
MLDGDLQKARIARGRANRFIMFDSILIETQNKSIWRMVEVQRPYHL